MVCPLAIAAYAPCRLAKSCAPGAWPRQRNNHVPPQIRWVAGEKVSGTFFKRGMESAGFPDKSQKRWTTGRGRREPRASGFESLAGNQLRLEPAGSSLGFIQRWVEHSTVGIVIRDEGAHARRRPRRWERSKRPPYVI